VEQYPTGFLKLDWELIMVLKTDLLLHQIQFLKTDYLGFAAKSFSWGQGVGCRVGLFHSPIRISKVKAITVFVK
jgi:hypothetical protein